jgi:hypothetical protein
VLALGRVVAEHDGAARSLGQRERARLEPFEVNELVEHPHALRRDAVLGDELVPARQVNGDVAEDARERRREVFGEIPVVAEEDGGHAREVQQRRQGLVGVLAVDDVGRRGELREVVHHGHGLAPQFGGERAEPRAVDDGRVAALQKPAREVAHVQLRPRPRFELDVGD